MLSHWRIADRCGERDPRLTKSRSPGTTGLVAALNLALVLAAVGCSAGETSRGGGDPITQPAIVWQPGNWSISWQDEFDGPAGQSPDATKWAFQTGGDGWGNKELQNYTDRPENVSLDGAGHLLITARREAYMGNEYTSGRLTTQGLFSQTYGRFEARMQLARGLGMWPAFWIMGDDIGEVGWPKAGEVDIMEQRGTELHQVWGSLHGPSTSGTVDVPVHYAGAVTDDVNTSFHTYAIEWDPKNIVFLVDDVPYAQVTPSRIPTYASWVWDHPFFVIMNLAVGGLFGGDPDDATPMPQSIVIDYVRVSTRMP